MWRKLSKQRLPLSITNPEGTKDLEKNRTAQLSWGGFCIYSAGVEQCLFERLARLTRNARVSISRCFLKHFQGVSSSARKKSFSAIVIVIVV